MRRLLGILALAACPHAADAGEGAFSNYVPGAYGDFGLAVPNAPGLEAVVTGIAFAGLSANVTDPATGAPTAIDADAQLVAATLTWTSKAFWDGLRFSAGVTVPYVNTNAAADLDFGLFGVQSVRDEDDGFGDIVFQPAALFGDIELGEDRKFYWSLSEFVTAPTARFSAARIASPGRNHWTFDTVGAASFIDWGNGYEIGAAAGVMVNTTNPETNYRSGAEAHLDVVANMLVTDNFAIGATVYGVAQLARDSGAGAGADPLKGHAAGAGLQAFWTPDPETYTPNVRLKWLHDVTARDRLKGDYVYLTVEFPL